MTNEELLTELRGEIAKLREELANQQPRIVFVPTLVPQPYPVYPQPYFPPVPYQPYHPSYPPFIGAPTTLPTIQITWGADS